MVCFVLPAYREPAATETYRAALTRAKLRNGG